MLTELASAGQAKINWPCRSEAGGASAFAECRAFVLSPPLTSTLQRQIVTSLSGACDAEQPES
ncbi:hypothetical protein ACIRRA_43070 [Nocardia sp. NPDC101769]|uniref:hypothetical protein n=1 Tax=Nocardia sp. NPDC101769 TaxID=3364333 RepID=UPI003830B184